MLAVAGPWAHGTGERPYLARAFSVCRVRGSRLDFLVDEVGPGTKMLAELSPGDHLSVVGPLGVGFSSPAALSTRRAPGQAGQAGRALLVGGGVGLAPLVIWQEALDRADFDTAALVGFRSASHCGAADLLSGELDLATDDGSAGHGGFVTDLLEAKLSEKRSDVVYACGPADMLETVRRICAAQSVPAELALEEGMACGFGACFGCAVKTSSGYRRLCVDGPVVPAADLDESWLAR
jgi:NAD(P)H-flavin reductase